MGLDLWKEGTSHYRFTGKRCLCHPPVRPQSCPPRRCHRPRSRTGACDLAQMGRTAALYNTDYYAVSPLTLMGCYSDLKWFNGSQVGPLMDPLYTAMPIMNVNDSVVKCLCFFRRLLKQCDRCRFTGQLKGWREQGGSFLPDSPSILSYTVHRYALMFDIFNIVTKQKWI